MWAPPPPARLAPRHDDIIRSGEVEQLAKGSCRRWSIGSTPLCSQWSAFAT